VKFAPNVVWFSCTRTRSASPHFASASSSHTGVRHVQESTTTILSVCFATHATALITLLVCQRQSKMQVAALQGGQMLAKRRLTGFAQSVLPFTVWLSCHLLVHPLLPLHRSTPHRLPFGMRRSMRRMRRMKMRRHSHVPSPVQQRPPSCLHPCVWPCSSRTHPCSRRTHPCSRRTHPCSHRTHPCSACLSGVIIGSPPRKRTSSPWQCAHSFEIKEENTLSGTRWHAHSMHTRMHAHMHAHSHAHTHTHAAMHARTRY
jgi:hypothetical protein